jgi:hypothetical protein
MSGDGFLNFEGEGGLPPAPSCRRQVSGDVLGRLVAAVLLQHADLRLDGGFHLDDFVVGQVVGAFDGDGDAAGAGYLLACKNFYL